LKKWEQAAMKIQRGTEMGVPPAQSLESIYVIEGKTALAAGLIAARIKASGKYNYIIKVLTATECNLTFTENGKQVGESKFALEDARAAGLAGKGVWAKYARNMLFARALSNGARWYCPDVFGGSVYTPDELKNVELTGVESVPEVPGEPVAEAEVVAESVPISRARIASIHTAATSKGLTKQAFINLLQARFPVNETADLTAEQADTLTTEMAGLSVEEVEEFNLAATTADEEPAGASVFDEAADE
jgi:hypothetical protein